MTYLREAWQDIVDEYLWAPPSLPLFIYDSCDYTAHFRNIMRTWRTGVFIYQNDHDYIIQIGDTLRFVRGLPVPVFTTNPQRVNDYLSIFPERVKFVIVEYGWYDRAGTINQYVRDMIRLLRQAGRMDWPCPLVFAAYCTFDLSTIDPCRYRMIGYDGKPVVSSAAESDD